MKRARGHALLEIVTALVVMLPVLAAGVAALHAGQAALVRASAGALEARRNLALRTQLIRVVRDVDRSRLPIPPRIHIGGSPFPQFDSRSEAISMLRLNPSRTHRLDRVDGVSSVTACPLDPRARRTDGESRLQFVGLSPRGMVEVVALAPRPSSGGCREFSLMPVPSTVLQRVEEPPLSELQRLVPIEAAYTIGIDRAGALRYLGHVGTTVIESQPLMANFSGMRLRLEEGPEPGTIVVLGGIETAGRVRYDIRVSSAAPRLPLMTVLFNELY